MTDRACNFCDCTEKQVRYLVAGISAFICGKCIETAMMHYLAGRLRHENYEDPTLSSDQHTGDKQ